VAQESVLEHMTYGDILKGFWERIR